jgi:hypothetical protein
MGESSVGTDVPGEHRPERHGGAAADRAAAHFEFEHKVFRVGKSYFGLAADTSEPVFLVKVGDLSASLRLASMRREFRISPDSKDGQLLEMIEKGLRYVREIRPSDSIPRELLEGTASWSVAERHRILARTRIAAHLVDAAEGRPPAVMAPERLESLAGDTAFKEKARLAIPKIAERVGGPKRKREVLDRIDQLAREFAFIEGLRERLLVVRDIAGFIGQLAKTFRTDRALLPEIKRVQQLVRQPIDALAEKFAAVDAKVAPIETALAGFDAHVETIRADRDELHGALALWDDLVWKWGEADREKKDAARELIRETYRFVATYFPQNHDHR